MVLWGTGRKPLLKRTWHCPLIRPTLRVPVDILNVFFFCGPQTVSFPACSSVCVAATFLQRCVNEVISQAWLSAGGMWLSLYLLSRLCSESLCSHHPPSISPPFILHHRSLCCQDPVVDPSALTLSSMHPPSSLHLPYYHPLILHPPAIPPSSWDTTLTPIGWTDSSAVDWLAMPLFTDRLNLTTSAGWKSLDKRTIFLNLSGDISTSCVHPGSVHHHPSISSPSVSFWWK